MTLQLEVVTPDGAVLSTEASYVGVPGVAGQFGVLPGHVPLLSALAIGELYYRNGDNTGTFFVSGGFAEVTGEKVAILAEVAEPAEKIDMARAEAARKRAEERLLKARDDATIDIKRAQIALMRATARINIASVR